MASTKDYVKAAEILRGEYSIASTPETKIAVENVTALLADMFARDNTSFNRERFYEASLGRTTVRA